jgi:hypothetical protein
MFNQKHSLQMASGVAWSKVTNVKKLRDYIKK